MKLLRASIRQFQNGHNEPEIALVMEFDEKSLFSIVGYDVYTDELSNHDSEEDALQFLLRIAHTTQGTPAQPVFYNLTDTVPEDGDVGAEKTLANLRNSYIERAVFTPS